jgi:hypothetical protein
LVSREAEKYSYSPCALLMNNTQSGRCDIPRRRPTRRHQLACRRLRSLREGKGGKEATVVIDDEAVAERLCERWGSHNRVSNDRNAATSGDIGESPSSPTLATALAVNIHRVNRYGVDVAFH